MSGRSREDLAAAGNIAPPSLKMYHTTVEVVENTEKDKINFIVLMVKLTCGINYGQNSSCKRKCSKFC